MSVWSSSLPSLAACWTVDRVRGLSRPDICGSLTALSEALDEAALLSALQCVDEKPVGLMLTKQKLSGQCWTMQVCVGCLCRRVSTFFLMLPWLLQGFRPADNVMECM